ncbi:MAG: hypothetical protein QW828_03830 [Candidatus Bathyarchaeia archaeon]
MSKKTKMYHVVWEIYVDAPSSLEAAREALKVQRDPGSTATVFDVTPFEGETVRVDLLEEC